MGILTLRARSVGFVRGGDKTILDAIDLTADAGAVTALAGPTGSGKSTLLHLLGGLLRPTTGEVLADDDAISRWTAAHRDRWRRRVGLLFQHAELIGDLSAAENVLLPLVPRPGDLATKGEAVRRALEDLEVAAFADQAARDLSGGERQRVALARALVGEPEILLLDEPTAHQDDAHSARILEIVGAARDRGAIVVVASHDPRVLGAGLADQVGRLEDGRLHPGP